MSFKSEIMEVASVGETWDGMCAPDDDWGRDKLGEVTRDGEYHGCGDGSEEEGRDSPSCSFDPLGLGFYHNKKHSSKRLYSSKQHMLLWQIKAGSYQKRISNHWYVKAQIY